MSFLELWGDSVDPGNVGGVDLSGEHGVCKCSPLVWVCFLFVAVGLPIFWR